MSAARRKHLDSTETSLTELQSDVILVQCFCDVEEDIQSDYYSFGDLGPEDKVTQYTDIRGQPLSILVREVLLACKYDYIHRLTLLDGIISERCLLSKVIIEDLDLETPLNVSLRFRSWKTASYLINKYGGDLVTRTCTKQYYAGAMAIHFAIVGKNSKVIDEIISATDKKQRASLVNCRASGTFFRDYLQCSGYPLSLAILYGDNDTLTLMMSCGANIDNVDPDSGDTVFHEIVKYGLKDLEASRNMMQHLLNDDLAKSWFAEKFNIPSDRFDDNKCWEMKAYLLKIENHALYTALTYAALLGVHDIVKDILNTEGVYKFTRWNIGSTQCCRYDLSEIDPAVTSLVRPGRPNVLELLLYNQPYENLRTFTTTPIRQLASAKWKVYRYIQLIWALLHIGCMLTYTIHSVRVTRGAHKMMNLTWNLTDMEFEHNVRREKAKQLHSLADAFTKSTTASYFLAVIYSVFLVTDIVHAFIIFIKARLFRWMYSNSKYYKAPWGLVARFDEFWLVMITFVISNAYIFNGMVINVTDLSGIYALSIALLSGWYFVLYFARSLETTSYFISLLHRILFTDVARFGIVIFLLTFSFSIAFTVLNLGPDKGMPDQLEGVSVAMQNMYFLMLGFGDFDFLDNSQSEQLTALLEFLFVSLATILVLNMLIAAMTDTYMELAPFKRAISVKLRATSVMTLEWRFPKCIISRLSSRYTKRDPFSGLHYLEVFDVKV